MIVLSFECGRTPVTNLGVQPVYAEPVSGNSLLPADMSMYVNEGGKWELVAVMEYSDLIINGSIDDSLFD